MQGQAKDDEVYGKGNLYAYKYRMNDARTIRFFSPDPLHAKYPHNSDYAFSENRLTDGVELEGAEYLGSNASRVEFKYGQLRLKMANFHNTTYNEYKSRLKDPRNWTTRADGTKDIGINVTVAEVNYMGPEPSIPQAADISNKGSAESIENYKSNFANNRYDQRPGIAGPSGKGLVITRAAVVIDAINLGLTSYIQWASKDDADKVNEHRQVAMKARENMVSAIRSGMIPQKYLNKEGITNIMNVILQGVNNTKDAEIYNIGVKIYNINNSPKSIYIPSNLDNFPGITTPAPSPPPVSIEN